MNNSFKKITLTALLAGMLITPAATSASAEPIKWAWAAKKACWDNLPTWAKVGTGAGLATLYGINLWKYRASKGNKENQTYPTWFKRPFIGGWEYLTDIFWARHTESSSTLTGISNKINGLTTNVNDVKTRVTKTEANINTLNSNTNIISDALKKSDSANFSNLQLLELNK